MAVVDSPELWAGGTDPGGELGDEDPGVSSWCLVDLCIGGMRSLVSVAGSKAPGKGDSVDRNLSVAVCMTGDPSLCLSLLSGSGEGVWDLSEGRVSDFLHRRFLLVAVGVLP